MPRAGCSPSSLPAGDATAETFPCQPPKVHAYRQQSPCRRPVRISTTWVFPLQSGTGRKGGGMALLNFIDRVVIPTALIALFAGGVGGVLLGCALVFRSGAALSFMTRMNSWVSTRQALKPLEVARHIESSAGPGGRPPALGSLLVLCGVPPVYFFLPPLLLPPRPHF